MILARTLLLGLVVSLAAASCGGSVTIRGPSAACPLDVTGPADLLVCLPGDFFINGVASNERGMLVAISTSSERVDFGGIHVIESLRDALLYFDSEGALRWHAEGGCSSCALALAPDGSAIAAGKGGVSWYSSTGERTSPRPYAGDLRGVDGLSFARDGSTIVATIDRGADDSATVKMLRLGRDGTTQRLSSTELTVPHARDRGDFAIDQEAIWIGTYEAPGGMRTSSIGPRGVSHVAFAPGLRSFRPLSRGGVFFHDRDNQTEVCADPSRDSTLLAILRDGALGWSRCVKMVHSWIGDGDATPNGLVISGGTRGDGTISGQRVGGSRADSAFVARLAFDGSLGNVTRVDSSSVGAAIKHVQVLTDGRILALGMFGERHDDNSLVRRPDPFAPPPPPPRQGAFILRTR